MKNLKSYADGDVNQEVCSIISVVFQIQTICYADHHLEYFVNIFHQGRNFPHIIHITIPSHVARNSKTEDELRFWLLYLTPFFSIAFSILYFRQDSPSMMMHLTKYIVFFQFIFCRCQLFRLVLEILIWRYSLCLK